MDITICEEGAEDAKKITEIHNEAFGEECEGKLVNALRKSEYFIPELSLVAKHREEIIGHILFTKISIENNMGKHTSLALVPVSVVKKFQNKGVGKLLIQKGIEKAKELGFDSIIVLGHPSYYLQFGFLPASSWEICPPVDGVPDDAFMGLELKDGALTGVSGVVRYPKEFVLIA